MKKFNFLFLVLPFLFGCANIFDENNSNQSEYGSISVGNESRAIFVDDIKAAKASVYGFDSSGNKFTKSVTATVKNGAGSFTISEIPVCKNAVLEIESYGDTSFSTKIEKTVLYYLCEEIKAGKNDSVQVTWETSKKGSVFASLIKNEINTNTLTSEEISKIEAAIPSDTHASLIDSSSIASDFKSGSLKDSSSYKLTAGSVKITANSLSGCTIQVTDPCSSISSVLESDSESVTISGVAPGTWNVYAVLDGEIKASTTVTLSSGGTKSVTLGKEETFDGIKILVAKSLNYPMIYYWSCSDATTYPNVSWPGVEMDSTSSDEDYIFKFAGISSVKVLITNSDGGKLCSSDMELKEKGTYRITSSGAQKTSGSEEIVVPVLKASISVLGSTVEGSTITFSAANSTGEIASYLWNIDGETYTESQVQKTYSTAGSYSVTLTVTDSNGETSSDSRTVKIVKPGDFTHRDFREENVYFLLTDRFADGDSTNNNIWGDEYLPNGTSDLYTFNESKTGVLSYYHGGDFKGIINNLDYIADMGFTAIWITPSVKQPEGRFYNGGDYEASAFHGYWGYDFDQIDPHLHSSGKDSDGWDDYKAFIQACHAKGIRVMQDIVLNHGNHTSAAGATKWKDYSVQTIMDGKEWAWKTLDPYYESDTSKNGFYSYYGFGQCSDLIDFGHLGEDGKDSRQHLINVYKKFIDAGVDAFRIDTIAYIPSEFAGEFADAMYNYAKSKGNDYFYMIGEAWCGRHDAVDRHSKDTTDSLHMLDMHLSCLDYPGQMQGVFKDGGDFAQYNNATNDDSSFACMTPEEYTKTAMFVDNHDCYRNEAIYSESQYKNALNYIYIFRGVPIVFYGTEAMYSWNGTHPTTNKDDVVSRWMLGDVGINYVKNNQPPMYKHLKVLNEIRSNSPCIQKGEQENLVLSGNQAVFTRTYNGKVAYVGLNTSSQAYSYSFTVNSGTYKLISCSSNGTYSSSTITASGTYSLSVPGNGFAFIEQQ